MNMRDKIAACIPDYGQSTDEDFAVKAADAILAALPDMIPDLVWERDDDVPNIADAVGVGHLYSVITRHDGKGSLRIDRMNHEHSEHDSPFLAECAANAHNKAQLCKAMGWTL